MVSLITVSRGNVQFKNKKALRIHHVKETWATLKKNLKQKLKHIISIAPKLRKGEWASQINPSLRKQNTTDKSTDRVKVFLTRNPSGLASKLPGQKEIVRQISLKKKKKQFLSCYIKCHLDIFQRNVLRDIQNVLQSMVRNSTRESC